MSWVSVVRQENFKEKHVTNLKTVVPKSVTSVYAESKCK